MVEIYFMHYNLGRVHQALRVTPAMEAGIDGAHVPVLPGCVAVGRTAADGANR